MADGTDGRWAGRNADKDRLRNAVWSALEQGQLNVGPFRSAIPNFAGADEAARLLSRMPGWDSARIVKCNPDPPQIPVRLRALYDGKLVYTPVPELTKDFPFLLLDPAVLRAKGGSASSWRRRRRARWSMASASISKRWSRWTSSSSAASA